MDAFVPSFVFVEVVEWFRFEGKDRAHHTELVADGVLHDHPRNVFLAFVDALRTQRRQGRPPLSGAIAADLDGRDDAHRHIRDVCESAFALTPQST